MKLAALMIVTCLTVSTSFAKTCSCYSFTFDHQTQSCDVNRDPVHKVTGLDWYVPCRYAPEVKDYCGAQGLYVEYSNALHACQKRH